MRETSDINLVVSMQPTYSERGRERERERERGREREGERERGRRKEEEREGGRREGEEEGVGERGKKEEDYMHYSHVYTCIQVMYIFK